MPGLAHTHIHKNATHYYICFYCFSLFFFCVKLSRKSLNQRMGGRGVWGGPSKRTQNKWKRNALVCLFFIEFKSGGLLSKRAASKSCPLKPCSKWMAILDRPLRFTLFIDYVFIFFRSFLSILSEFGVKFVMFLECYVCACWVFFVVVLFWLKSRGCLVVVVVGGLSA